MSVFFNKNAKILVFDEVEKKVDAEKKVNKNSEIYFSHKKLYCGICSAFGVLYHRVVAIIS